MPKLELWLSSSIKVFTRKRWRLASTQAASQKTMQQHSIHVWLLGRYGCSYPSSKELHAWSVNPSVTSWREYFSLFGHLQQFKFAQNSQQFSQVGSKFCQNTKYTLKRLPNKILKVCPSGEISLNLVILFNSQSNFQRASSCTATTSSATTWRGLSSRSNGTLTMTQSPSTSGCLPGAARPRSLGPILKTTWTLDTSVTR